MDKFAVDLEKVLDEFEYNEGREEAVVPAVIKNSLQHISQKPLRPPAASYRRPAFEPINLADADFAAAAISSASHTTILKQNNYKEANSNVIRNVNHSENFSSPNLQNIVHNVRSEVSDPVKSDNVVDELQESSDTFPTITSPDDTPDLLDSNSLKPIQIKVNKNLTSELNTQLPDITTSVRSGSTLTDSIESSDQPTFDLIRPHTPSHSLSKEELPPVVDVGSVIKNIPELQIKPLNFDSLGEVPESELVEYLNVLEELESLENTATTEQIDETLYKPDDILDNSIAVKSDELNVETVDNSNSFVESSEVINSNLVHNISHKLDDNKKDGDSFKSSVDDFNVVVNKSSDDPVESIETVFKLTEKENNQNNEILQLGQDLDDRSVENTVSKSNDSLNKLDEDIKEPSINGTFNTPCHIENINNTNINPVNSCIDESEDKSITIQSSQNAGELVLERTSESGSNDNKILKDGLCSNIEVIPTVNSDSQGKGLNHNDNEVIVIPNDVQETELSTGNERRKDIHCDDSVALSQSEVLIEPQFDNKDHLSNVCTDPSTSNSGYKSDTDPPQSCVPETNPSFHLQSLEVIGTENEEIENCQNEERAGLQKNEEIRDTPEDFNEQMSEIYYNSEDGGSSSEPNDGEGSKPLRPNTLALPSHVVTDSEESPTPTSARGNTMSSIISPEERSLGKVPPFWVPDNEADACMQCLNKFTVIKRRHHCRACGLVLCSKCCGLRAPLEYMEFQEARVCQQCFTIIVRVSVEEGRYSLGRQPNPNNPMEYCSTIPPMQQAATALLQPPPSVLVPTGVLKREGRAKSDVPKQVMFSDGIRPGGDLTELDGYSETTTRLPPRRGVRRLATPPGGKGSNNIARRPLNPNTQSLIPSDGGLPPVVTIERGQLVFLDDVTEITDQVIKFSINYNLFVNVKRVKLDCCVNRECWSITSDGLACMGQDEIALVLECLPDEQLPPQDVFHLINTVYQDTFKGSSVSEMCFTPSFSSNLLGSKDHGGFLYIRPSLQCTTQLLLPTQPYLFAILVHRWETPWAKLFPLRLVLRLGAEYRYYPTPLVSIRNRPPLYTDIGHTIMKILVDFKTYNYSLATVRGLLIHMEDRQTTILFPRNRYDQVVRALNNSNDSVLAFGANLSLIADSHLVCIQGTQDENTYNTQAININNKPRRVTGASFVVFNGALKTAGLSGKTSIMEDGLMVHLPSDSMAALRTALRDMHDFTISCGPNDEETVLLKWTDDDINFNIGVKSSIDERPLDGIPSIRVHNGTDYPSNSKIIRWTEVFILQCDEGNKANDPEYISKVSEPLAKATCIALVPVLDLLAEANLTTVAVRAVIHPENVCYEAGSNGEKLPWQYMKQLDDKLVPVVHQAAMSAQDKPAVLELIFRVMNLQ